MKKWKGYTENQALQVELQEGLHKLFKLLNMITICSALCMALGQCAGVFFEKLGMVDYVLRIYVLLFCLLVVLNETDLFSLTRDSKLLRIWVFRGAFYGFIGVLGLSENAAFPTIGREGFLQRDPALNSIFVFSLLMILVGLLYFTMGALCLQLVYNRLEEDYRERVERSKERRKMTQTYGAVNDEVV
jgi:uncharacterized PurR-regulated membrane protein YhhQ (DUF165 family)